MPVQDPATLKNAPWLNHPSLQKLFAVMNEGGQETRVVGGAVRNHLLAAPVTDIDLATTLSPQQVIERAEKAGFKTIPTGIDHGTVTLVINGQTYEITSLRKDIKTDGRHAIVEYGTDWLQDASRRDFTMNALYVSHDGTLHDPLGTGQDDVKARKLRFIGTSEHRIQEDYLRTLRFYRLAAQYGEPPFDSAAIRATIKCRQGLANLSPERVNNELVKLLKAPLAKQILPLLYQNGLLSQILASAPNLIPALRGINIENHLNLPPNSMFRLSLLAVYHQGDIKRLKKLFKLSNAQEDTLQMSQAYKALPPLDVNAGDEHHKAHYVLGSQAYTLAFLTKWATGKHATNDQSITKLFQKESNRIVPTFPLSGKDLIYAGVQPGPDLGKKLKALENIWLEKNFTLTTDELLQKLDTLQDTLTDFKEF